jgi:hypothetical protein
MTRLFISHRARLMPDSIVEWLSPTALHPDAPASRSVPDVRGWILNVPDDGSVEPPGDLLARILSHRALCEDKVLQVLEEDRRTAMTLRTGYRAVHLIGVLGEWRSERAVQPLVDRLRSQRLFGTEEAVLALIRIGPCAVGPVSRLLADSSARPVARANALRVLCGLLQSTREPDTPPSFQSLNDGWRRRFVKETLLLVSDPTTADDLRHEAILRLCDLRAIQAWPEIERAFRLQQVPDRYGLSLSSARDIMEGRVLLLDLPNWHTPMCLLD